MRHAPPHAPSRTRGSRSPLKRRGRVTVTGHRGAPMPREKTGRSPRAPFWKSLPDTGAGREGLRGLRRGVLPELEPAEVVQAVSGGGGSEGETGSRLTHAAGVCGGASSVRVLRCAVSAAAPDPEVLFGGPSVCGPESGGAGVALQPGPPGGQEALGSEGGVGDGDLLGVDGVRPSDPPRGAVGPRARAGRAEPAAAR